MPRAIPRHVFVRTSLFNRDEDIPLNGVAFSIEIFEKIFKLSYPAAVVAGNVETTKIVDCLLGALGLQAGSQGTMNNFLLAMKRCSITKLFVVVQVQGQLLMAQMLLSHI